MVKTLFPLQGSKGLILGLGTKISQPHGIAKKKKKKIPPGRRHGGLREQ